MASPCVIFAQDMKKKLNASERDKDELEKQMAELQAEMKEHKSAQMRTESDSAKTAGLMDEVAALKTERAELQAHSSHLRAETERLDSEHLASVAETHRLKAANTSLQEQNRRLEQEASAAQSSLAQQHAAEAERRSMRSEEELSELTEQWKSDVATRDARIASMEVIAADLQSLLSESHTRSEILETQAQELAAESDEMMTALKTAQRAEIAQMQTSLEDSLVARQSLEERIANGEAEASMLRHALEETRRQIEVASLEKQGEEESWALQQQEF